MTECDPHGSCSAYTHSDRLRWIAEFLELSGKAISVIACVDGFDYSPEIHQAAQRDLWALADELDTNIYDDRGRGTSEGVAHAVLGAIDELNRTGGIVFDLCKTGSPTMEFLEASHAIQCATSRLGEWAAHFIVHEQEDDAAVEYGQSYVPDSVDRAPNPTLMELGSGDGRL
jgi:hypothetical protein